VADAILADADLLACYTRRSAVLLDWNTVASVECTLDQRVIT
jgi:hypothetical protein